MEIGLFLAVRRLRRPEAVATLEVYDSVNVLEPATATDTELLPPPRGGGEGSAWRKYGDLCSARQGLGV